MLLYFCINIVSVSVFAFVLLYFYINIVSVRVVASVTVSIDGGVGVVVCCFLVFVVVGLFVFIYFSASISVFIGFLLSRYGFFRVFIDCVLFRLLFFFLCRSCRIVFERCC